MKLFEEFKEYETLWESDTHKPIEIRQGNDVYDLTKEEDFRASANKFAAYKAKVVKQSTKFKFTPEELKAYEDKQRALIATGLLNTLKERKADVQIIEQAKKLIKEFENTYTSGNYGPNSAEVKAKIDHYFK